MLERIYRLGERSRLAQRGGDRWLLCEHPLQSVRLNESAWHLLAALDGIAPLSTLLPDAGREWLDFLERQTARGLLRAAYRVLEPVARPLVEVVVPVYAADPAPLAACLAGLAGQSYPRERFRITVFDDASPVHLADRLGSPQIAPPVRWLRGEVNAGPASARNAAALAPAAGEPPAPLIAFIDSDCVPAPDWLARLVAVVDDPAVDAVGGAVLGFPDGSLLGRYEHRCSSLYLGAEPAPVALPGASLAYLPGANLVVKRAPFLRVGGFRAGQRLGEDVDLCWRLAAAGAGLFYWPEAVVRHRHRTRWRSFLARRRDYALSEGELRARFPQRFRRQRPGMETVALAVAAAGLMLGRPVLLAVALALPWAGAAWRTVRLRGVLRGREPAEAARVVLGAWLRLGAARVLQEARHWTRRRLLLWLPLPAVLPLLWPLTLSVLALGAWGEALARRPGLSPRVFLVGFAADALGYSLGLAELNLRRLARGIIHR